LRLSYLYGGRAHVAAAWFVPARLAFSKRRGFAANGEICYFGLGASAREELTDGANVEEEKDHGGEEADETYDRVHRPEGLEEQAKRSHQVLRGRSRVEGDLLQLLLVVRVLKRH